MKVLIIKEMKETTTLKAAREQLGKTQAQVAVEVGIPYQYYQLYEYDRGAQTIQTAIKIAKSLNSSVEELWGTPTYNDYNTNK